MLPVIRATKDSSLVRRGENDAAQRWPEVADIAGSGKSTEEEATDLAGSREEPHHGGRGGGSRQNPGRPVRHREGGGRSRRLRRRTARRCVGEAHRGGCTDGDGVGWGPPVSLLLRRLRYFSLASFSTGGTNSK